MKYFPAVCEEDGKFKAGVFQETDKHNKWLVVEIIQELFNTREEARLAAEKKLVELRPN